MQKTNRCLLRHPPPNPKLRPNNPLNHQQLRCRNYSRPHFRTHNRQRAI